MNSFRVARTALRAARPAAFRAPVLQRRGYAEATNDKLKLSLALPHSVRQHSIASLLASLTPRRPRSSLTCRISDHLQVLRGVCNLPHARADPTDFGALPIETFLSARCLSPSSAHT